MKFVRYHHPRYGLQRFIGKNVISAPFTPSLFLIFQHCWIFTHKRCLVQTSIFTVCRGMFVLDGHSSTSRIKRAEVE